MTKTDTSMPYTESSWKVNPSTVTVYPLFVVSGTQGEVVLITESGTVFHRGQVLDLANDTKAAAAMRDMVACCMEGVKT